MSVLRNSSPRSFHWRLQSPAHWIRNFIQVSNHVTWISIEAILLKLLLSLPAFNIIPKKDVLKKSPLSRGQGKFIVQQKARWAAWAAIVEDSGTPARVLCQHLSAHAEPTCLSLPRPSRTPRNPVINNPWTRPGHSHPHSCFSETKSKTWRKGLTIFQAVKPQGMPDFLQGGSMGSQLHHSHGYGNAQRGEQDVLILPRGSQLVVNIHRELSNAFIRKTGLEGFALQSQQRQQSKEIHVLRFLRSAR